MARRQYFANNAEEAIGMLVGLIGERASDLAISYDRADGPALADDEEPALDEAVEWRAVCHRRADGGTVTGSHIVEPATSHPKGLVYALVDVAEQLGVNCVVVV